MRSYDVLSPLIAAAVLLAGRTAFGVEESFPPEFGSLEVCASGSRVLDVSVSASGFSLIANAQGPQVAVMDPARMLAVCVRKGEEVEVAILARGIRKSCEVMVEATLLTGTAAEIGVSFADAKERLPIAAGQTVQLALKSGPSTSPAVIHLTTNCTNDEATVQWRHLCIATANQQFTIPLSVDTPSPHLTPPPVSPCLREPIQQALIEWDWRLQDGIGTARQPQTYLAVIQQTLQRGDKLIRDLQTTGVSLETQSAQWQTLRREYNVLSAGQPSDHQWEDLWRRVHRLRRKIALSNPLARVGPLLFAKQPTASFSHQLTQYLGRYARPGGGLFVLDSPGQTMDCRQLGAGALPEGSFQHPEASYDGKRVLFSYCQADSPAQPGLPGQPGRYFHLYDMSATGSNVRQLTDGPYNDFSPRYLPNGQIVMISTRRGGWHRCGGSPGNGCENHTLALAEADGSHARAISFHETQEWDPAVLHDGRVIYTRWDYVDRHAVYYEQLWTARPDGTSPTIYFGNNTLNPVGIWEAQPVPGSAQVMATAAPHHGMTAGSIILVDVAKGVDGIQSISRLTPDAPFPESETHMQPKAWHAPAGLAKPPAVPVEAQRWPGHCYKSPYPLSETYFLAAYSYDALIGEPDANPINMFGIYLVDRFGNKELLYRDPNISSLWPVPLRPRTRPATVQSAQETAAQQDGAFFVSNVYESDPPLPHDSVRRLRILQVLPKSTPGINWPSVGLPNASPGKQVLGTVPVEPDGSAYFRAPAGIPLSFQVLDDQHRAVQTMRSIVYLQPREVQSCTGCHEPRNTTPPPSDMAMALRRPASTIDPAPDGARPLSYPILVQPVLDKHCIGCHNAEKPDGNVVLTGGPEGNYTVSYNALAPRVTYSAWGGRSGDFRQVNSEPSSQPGFFGARGSRLMDLLLEGHYDVSLSEEDIERLSTWMDANALFYGTFNHEDQARQQLGQRIDGPDLE